jgi:hypothetical protein
MGIDFESALTAEKGENNKASNNNSHIIVREKVQNINRTKQELPH